MGARMHRELETSEQVFLSATEQNEFPVGCFLAVSIFCGSTEFKRSIQSESVVRPDEFLVKNVTSVDCARGVSTHLTWEMKFNQSFQPLFLVSETIKTNTVKGQFCVRLVESILKMRVRSVGLQFNLLTTKNMFCNSADDWSFCRLRKKLFCGNCRVYYTPCSRKQKRRFRLRFARYGSVEHFHDCHRQESACVQHRFELTLNYLFQVFVSLLSNA